MLFLLPPSMLQHTCYSAVDAAGATLVALLPARERRRRPSPAKAAGAAGDEAVGLGERVKKERKKEKREKKDKREKADKKRRREEERGQEQVGGSLPDAH